MLQPNQLLAANQLLRRQQVLQQELMAAPQQLQLRLLGVLQAAAASPGFQALSPAQREQVLRQMLQGPPPGNSAAK